LGYSRRLLVGYSGKRPGAKRGTREAVSGKQGRLLSLYDLERARGGRR